jgi:hypothetical protein
MRRTAAAAVGLTIGIGLLACGCDHHTSGVTTATATGYLQAADEANRQVAAARATMAAAPTDLAHLRAGLLGIAQAKEGLDRAVRAMTPPANLAGDVAKLLSADAAFEADLHRAAAAASVAEVTADETAVLASGQAALDAANRVRTDLGLPPVP